MATVVFPSTPRPMTRRTRTSAYPAPARSTMPTDKVSDARRNDTVTLLLLSTAFLLAYLEMDIKECKSGDVIDEVNNIVGY